MGLGRDNDSRVSGFESSPDELRKLIQEKLIVRIKPGLVSAGDLHNRREWCGRAVGSDPWDATQPKLKEIVTGKSLTDKMLASKNGVHSSQ